MSEFFTHYGAFIIACIIFIGMWALSLYATYNGRSGAPFIGGIAMIMGGLSTPHKWLALLGLLDYITFAIIYAFIDGVRYARRNERFIKAFEKHGFSTVPKEYKDKHISVKAGDDEPLVWDYCENRPYGLRTPDVFFAICYDEKTEKRTLLVDTGKKDSEIKAVPLIYDSIEIKGYKKTFLKKAQTVSVKIKIDHE